MLELIVLGQIPGTSIQITYVMVLAIAAGFFGTLLMASIIRRIARAFKDMKELPTQEPVLQ